jgi:hypothetical protein
LALNVGFFLTSFIGLTYFFACSFPFHSIGHIHNQGTPFWI